jgi:CDP-diacylglycerol pyrophosphatase
LTALLGSPVSAAHPNALWHVVHDLCLRDARLTGRPAPCLAVNRREGYAVVPDPRRRTQVLLVPTTPIPGIESPGLLRPDAPNYWQAAWDARRFFEKRVGHPVPRDRIAMAINAATSRSQNQLHIHLDCVRPGVRQVLMEHEADIGPDWAPLDVALGGRFFMARRVEGENLGFRDPFKLLARDDPHAAADMADETLVVVGATFSNGSPGFVLLSNADDRAFGEALLDHKCAVLALP